MLKTQIKIVLGGLFGDEGKGNTVQYLCKQALSEGRKPLVIRFCGGPQAGHRIVHEGKSHVASTFGSGSLVGVPTFYAGTPNCFIDPISLKLEKENLENLGVNPKLYIAGCPSFITPYDVEAGRLDAKITNDGTCGKGIFPTYVRYSNRDMILPWDLEDVAKFWRMERNEEYEVKYNESWKEVLNCHAHSDTLKDFDTLIFEGTQGLLLDKDFGFMPNCTPSNVGLKGVYPGFLNEETEVYIVTRTYLTRHGNGYVPEFEDKVFQHFTLDEPTNLDTGYQGKFKRGIFSVPLLLRAFDRHALDNYPVKYKLVVTHCDCIKDEMVPYVDSHNYMDSTNLDTMISDIVNNSCIEFENVLLFNSEEM